MSFQTSEKECIERERERDDDDDDDDESLYTHASAFGVFFITCKRLAKALPPTHHTPLS